MPADPCERGSSVEDAAMHANSDPSAKMHVVPSFAARFGTKPESVRRILRGMIAATNSSSMSSSTDARRWDLVCARDASADGSFVFAVRTTGVFCRPSCAARRPKRENVRFFTTNADAERAGFRACKRCSPLGASIGERRARRIAHACEVLATSEERMTLAELARRVGSSPFRLQREFKDALGLSPREYAAAKRDERAAASLPRSKSVVEAAFDAGFGSAGRFYARSRAVAGMTARARRAGGNGIEVRYAFHATTLGTLLVAATEKGLCDVRLGADRAALERELRDVFPNAKLARGDAELSKWVAEVVAHVEEPSRARALPLDARGTAFQARVWKALRSIPRGSTMTYQELARAIGSPSSTRAVARACATNPLALVVPCHRVVRTDGGLGGYRWGIERKREILRREGVE